MTEEFKPFTDFAGIHRAATAHARDVYFKHYGIYHTDDPAWEIGNDRHSFWLDAFDEKQKEHILDEHSSFHICP